MADFLKTVKRKTFLSEVMYYSLNVGLVIVIFVIAQTVQSLLLAIILILLSKWRVLAVRPRYWWTNIQANMVDIIVGVSVAVLMFLPQAPLGLQIILALFYAAWLLFIKPLSKRWHMLLQSFVALVLGVTALYSVSYEWPVAVVVACMSIIGYSVARHFLFNHDEEQITLLSVIWGLFFAEVGWLAYFWAFGYAIPGAPAVKIPQVTIVVVLMSFVAERAYRSWEKNGHVVLGDVVMPVIFSSLLIVVILIFFNSVTI